MTDTPTPPSRDPSERNKLLMRGLFMLILAVFFWVAKWALMLIGLVQFFWALFTEKPNPALRDFGAALSDWLRQTGRFLVFASEDKPFPWAEWPKGE